MHRIQRLVQLLAILIFLYVSSNSVVLASSDYRYERLQAGKYYTLEEYPIDTIYTLKLTAPAITTIDWKGNKDGEIIIDFYADKDCTEEAYTTYYIHTAKGSETLSLVKGTYYITLYNSAGVDTARARIKAQKAINQNNYRMSKAVPLAANKKLQIAQTPDCCYTRWYRITLKKNKPITVYTNEEQAGYVSVFDSQARRIKCTVGSTKITTENRLKKGTYYLRVMHSQSIYSDYVGDYITLKWN